jgi:hypothetical protein
MHRVLNQKANAAVKTKNTIFAIGIRVWYGPNRASLRDTYDLSVGTDGCYTATVDGSEALGGPTITLPDGRNVRNLLYTFEGCFDTTGA